MKPKSESPSDVQNFVDKVTEFQTELYENPKDMELIRAWLWEIFRNWKPLELKIERIRESKADSQKRSWHYLWKLIVDFLANQSQ